MISVFDTQPVILEEKDGHVLTVSRNGLLYKDSNGEVLKDVDFEDVNGILPLRYLNSNISYNLIFRGRNWKIWLLSWIRIGTIPLAAIIYGRPKPLLPLLPVIS